MSEGPAVPAALLIVSLLLSLDRPHEQP